MPVTIKKMSENNLVKFTMTHGLYLGLAFSAMVIVYKLFGGIHHPGDTVGIVNAAILSFGILVFGKKYKAIWFQNEFLYKNALGFGVMMTLFSAIIYSFFSYWYYGVIEPTGIANYIEQMRLAYTQNQSFTEDQVNALVALYNNTLTPAIMAFVVFLSQFIIGVLISLVMAALLKTPNNLQQNNL